MELARRFLRSLGPASPARFARWAAVGAADARASFARIRHELVGVEWLGGTGLLAADAEQLLAAEPFTGVTFLAFGGDPVLQPGEDIVGTARSQRRETLPRWASSGLVLLDCEIVAAWGRSKRQITIFPLGRLDGKHRHDIEGEALAMPVEGGAVNVVWREERQRRS